MKARSRSMVNTQNNLPPSELKLAKKLAKLRVAAAVRELSKQLDIAKPLNESTVRSIKKAYLSEVRTRAIECVDNKDKLTKRIG